MKRGTRFFCQCKDCRKAKKKGLILGTRRARHFQSGFTPDGMRGPFSDYVPYHRYQKGRDKG
jgi:hypothetical protein